MLISFILAYLIRVLTLVIALPNGDPVEMSTNLDFSLWLLFGFDLVWICYSGVC